MKGQLELLIKLQLFDSAILSAQRIQEEHPQKIMQLEEALEKERKELQSQEMQLEKSKKKRTGKEQDLAIEEEKVRKARERLTAVKTNKEYQAALKEIEAIENQCEQALKLLGTRTDGLSSQELLSEFNGS